jgi:hypothetical protein
MSTSYPNLDQILKAHAILRQFGDYDTSIVGAVGEVYAQDVLKMEKAGCIPPQDLGIRWK